MTYIWTAEYGIAADDLAAPSTLSHIFFIWSDKADLARLMDFEDLEPAMTPEVGRPLINGKAAEFRANPALPAAIRADVLGALEMFDRDEPFNRTINDMAVFVLGMVALALHYSVGLSHRTLRNWAIARWRKSAARVASIRRRCVGRDVDTRRPLQHS